MPSLSVSGRALASALLRSFLDGHQLGVDLGCEQGIKFNTGGKDQLLVDMRIPFKDNKRFIGIAFRDHDTCC